MRELQRLDYAARDFGDLDVADLAFVLFKAVNNGVPLRKISERIREHCECGR